MVICDENLPVPLDRRVWLEAVALVEAGYDVTVIGPRGQGAMGRLHERRDGVRVLRYPQRAASGLAGYLVEYLPSLAFTTVLLLGLRLRGRIDAVHGCNPPDLFFLLGRLARLWGARYVFDQHDANPELAAAKWGDRRVGRWLVRLTRALEGASYRTADAVLVPNDSYARIAAGRGRVGADRLSVVRNAPPAGRFRELAAGVARTTGGPFRIGYVGVMGAQDGVDILVDALGVLRADRPDLDVRADLVGDGESRPVLERRAAALGIADRTTFHGYRQADEFVPLLAATDVCVSPDPPTPFNDVSTMTKVVEYLAIGRPVVAFELTETAALIGAAGRIVADASPAGLAGALAALADDRTALGRLDAVARTRFEELDIAWERSARELVAVYRRLLGPAPADRPSPSTTTS